MTVDYEILDDVTDADLAVRVRGASPEELFCNGAAAIMNEMTGSDLPDRGGECRFGELSSPELDLLYFRFLNEILYFKDAESLLLLPERIEIYKTGELFLCSYVLRGMKMLPGPFVSRVDIKAVTMHGLKVYRENDVWFAESVFDV